MATENDVPGGFRPKVRRQLGEKLETEATASAAG
jgi:hypothetical protein